MTCRPDWIRLVGSDSCAPWLIEHLTDLFGDPIECNGAKFFQRGLQWHPGILLSWGHKSEIVMIDLQGSRLACTPVDEFMKLTAEILMCGFHCTRIDLAVDHVGMDLKLYEHALKSCQAGELCKLRSYAYDPEFKADGTPTRRIIKLGKRSSPICIRIYDKGLETGTLPQGQWERFEVEFKDDRANEVCMTLASADVRMREALWRYVIGAVDFREVTGRTELNRRPRVGWWSDYIGQSVPLECPPCPKESTYESWKRWFQESAAPRLLQFAEILGIPPDEFFRMLTKSVKPACTRTAAVVDLVLKQGDAAIETEH